MIYTHALNAALRRALETDPRVVLLGEDLADPYGGAFKVTRGLTTDFPTRVRTTPISEGAIAGLSAGLALSGFRPIAEIMFGDFVTLCFDQVVNHIAKYQAMYDGGATCPVIIRAPMGGHRGYGPTHSQCLEKHFFGVPHLRVAAASSFHAPWDTLSALLADDAPTLFVEHKLLYPQHVTAPVAGRVGDALASTITTHGSLPTVSLSFVPREDCTATVVAYGYEALLALQVLERLAVEEEIFAELLVPSQLSPLDLSPIERSVAVTGSLLTVEEGTAGWAWGAEIACSIQKNLFGRLRKPVEVLASKPTVIPGAKHLEREVLVGEAHIERAVREATT